jgi:hypothetical protein
VSAPKKEQGTRLKRPLDQGVIKNMACTPKFHKHGKRLAVEAEKPSECLCLGKEPKFRWREHEHSVSLPVLKLQYESWYSCIISILGIRCFRELSV